MKQGKITLFLLIFCLLSGGVYVFLKHNVKPTDDKKRSRVLDGFSGDQVRRLEITGADRQFEFVKKAGVWSIQKPSVLRADKSEIDNLLYMVEFLEQRRKITPLEIRESKNTLADYGLEKPRLSLMLNTDKKQYRIDIGYETRQSEGAYIKVGDDKNVYLISKALTEKLEQPLEKWRNRSVFDFDGTKVVRLEIKTPKRSLEIARQADAWRIVQPLNVRASSRVVDSLVNDLVDLKAERYLSEGSADLKKYHLDEPFYEVVVKTEKSGDVGQTLFIGSFLTDNPADKQWSAVLKGQNSIMAVPAKFVQELDADIKDLRDNQLFHLDNRDVQVIEVRRGDKLVRVEKAGEGWRMTEPKAAAADQQTVDQFLAKFSGLKIQEFTTDVLTEVEKYGVGDKAPVVRLLGQKNEKGEPAVLAQIRIGNKNAKKALRSIKRDDESSIYGIGEEDLRFIPENALDLRDRVFLTMNKEAIKEVNLKSGKKEVFARKNEKGEWVSDGKLDRTIFDKILNDVSRMIAIRLIAENEKFSDEKYGFNHPLGMLSIVEKSGQEETRYEFIIGSKVEGRNYLYYKNGQLIVEIPVSVAEELTTPFAVK